MQAATILKSPKLLIAGALLLAFGAGVIFEGYTNFASTSASTTDPAAVQPATNSLVPNAAPAVTAPARTAAPTRVVASAPARTTTVERKRRSWQKEALIIGGSAGAGAAIGAVAGGGKGAAIGALSGGAAGTIYDVATRNK
jgi:hypothetical protein